MSEFNLFIDSIKSGSEKDFQKYCKSEFLEKEFGKFDWRPIHQACFSGHVRIVRMLIDKKCNINVCDNVNWYPIHQACFGGHVEIVEMLINKRCNINTCDKKNWYPIHYACQNGHVNIVKILVKNNCVLENNRSHIHANPVKVVPILINNKFKIDSLLNNNTHPIHVACQCEQVEILNILINSGCDIEACDDNKLRPIHYACYSGHVEIVRILINKKCNIEACDDFDLHPIHYACYSGHMNIVQILINNKCNLEAIDKYNLYPIHYACQENHVDIVKLLINNKCNIEAIDKHNFYPIHFACQENYVEIVQILISNNCNIEACTNNNWRPIHFACEESHVEIVKILIDKKCNIEAINSNSQSALDISYEKGNQEIINLLEKYRASLSTLEKMIFSLDIICNSNCNHKFCSTSLISNNFEKGKPLKSGSYGAIYRIESSQTEKIFAVKILNRCFQPKDSRIIENNLSQFIDRLSHVRIVKYFGVMELDNHLHVFMEYLSGGTLNDKINNHPLTQQAVLIYTKQILEGLEYLHDNKIIHRDLKPDNILLDCENNVKLADFGVSKLLITTEGHTAETYSNCGTTNFMAPEIMDNKPYTFSADIWSLGATITNMLTGKQPYQQMNPQSIIRRVSIDGNIEMPPVQLIPKIMKEFLQKLLNKEPSKRPTATELLKHEIFSTNVNSTTCILI